MIKRKVALDIPPIWEINPIWATLTFEQRLYVESHLSLVMYRKNEIIYREGDTPDGVLLLVSGKVRVRRSSGCRNPVTSSVIVPR